MSTTRSTQRRPQLDARRPGQRLGQGGVAPGLAHAAERDVRGEAPRLARKAERREPAVHAGGESGQRGPARADPRPEHPRPGGRGKRAEAADGEIERLHDPRRPRPARWRSRPRARVHRTEKLQREVIVAAPTHETPRATDRSGAAASSRRCRSAGGRVTATNARIDAMSAGPRPAAGAAGNPAPSRPPAASPRGGRRETRNAAPPLRPERHADEHRPHRLGRGAAVRAGDPVTARPQSLPARAQTPCAMASAQGALTAPWARRIVLGHAEQLLLGAVRVVTTPRSKYADEPSTSVRRSPTSPPVHDSATASVSPRSSSSRPTTCSRRSPSGRSSRRRGPRRATASAAAKVPAADSGRSPRLHPHPHLAVDAEQAGRHRRPARRDGPAPAGRRAVLRAPPRGHPTVRSTGTASCRDRAIARCDERQEIPLDRRSHRRRRAAGTATIPSAPLHRPRRLGPARFPHHRALRQEGLSLGRARQRAIDAVVARGRAAERRSSRTTRVPVARATTRRTRSPSEPSAPATTTVSGAPGARACSKAASSGSTSVRLATGTPALLEVQDERQRLAVGAAPPPRDNHDHARAACRSHGEDLRRPSRPPRSQRAAPSTARA